MANNDLAKKCADLKARYEKATQEVSRMTGALENMTEQLKTGWKVTSMKDARKLLAKLEKEKEAAEQSLREEIETLEEKWGEII